MMGHFCGSAERLAYPRCLATLRNSIACYRIKRRAKRRRMPAICRRGPKPRMPVRGTRWHSARRSLVLKSFQLNQSQDRLPELQLLNDLSNGGAINDHTLDVLYDHRHVRFAGLTIFPEFFRQTVSVVDRSLVAGQ